MYISDVLYKTFWYCMSIVTRHDCYNCIEANLKTHREVARYFLQTYSKREKYSYSSNIEIKERHSLQCIFKYIQIYITIYYTQTPTYIVNKIKINYRYT